jgi:hypothetical protein
MFGLLLLNVWCIVYLTVLGFFKRSALFCRMFGAPSNMLVLLATFC